MNKDTNVNVTDKPMDEAKGIHDELYYERHNNQKLNHRGLIFTTGRTRESLNGNWHFTIDPYDTGLRNDWSKAVVIDKEGRRLPWDYDALGEETIQVPSCWNQIKPEYLYYEGSAWYARRFDYTEKQPGERVFLRVGAASYDAKVFLNGHFLGNHYGASTPFFAALSEDLLESNLLQICVNNTRTTDRVPMRNTDWFNYGGIYRDVEIIRLPSRFIKDFLIELVPNNEYNLIRGKVELSDPAESEIATLAIPGLDIEHQIKFDDSATASFELEARPELWTPENPRLYEVRLSCGQDSIADRVGFRQIHTEGTKIFLNGQQTYLRGISCHEDDVNLGKATNEDDIRRRYAHAKELGCNFMRLAHYPHVELAAQIADEVGLLLWEEIPVYWAIDFPNPATYRDAENQLLELIKRDRNRASVIIWGVGNENADTEERFSFMSRLARAAKGLDPSRLTSAACLMNHETYSLTDRLMDSLDVVGINEYYGWYNPDFSTIADLQRNLKCRQPIVISEVGASAKAGFRSESKELFSEDFMAYFYEEQLKAIDKMKPVAGLSPWILYDFRAVRRFNSHQKGYNRKGLIAEDKRTKKLAFDVLRKFYERKKSEATDK